MAHINESCQTWMRHVTYEWVMSDMNAKRPWRGCVSSVAPPHMTWLQLFLLPVRHGSLNCATTHSFVTWLIRTWPVERGCVSFVAPLHACKRCERPCACIQLHGVHRWRRSDLKWLRLPKFQTNFHKIPRTYQTRFQGSPPNFKRIFSWVNGVPGTQTILRENCKI